MLPTRIEVESDLRRWHECTHCGAVWNLFDRQKILKHASEKHHLIIVCTEETYFDGTRILSDSSDSRNDG